MQKRRGVQPSNLGVSNKPYSAYKKLFKWVFIAVVIAGVSFAYSWVCTSDHEAASGDGRNAAAVSDLKMSELMSDSQMTLDEKAEKILNSMSDAEKVGQMLMIGVHGKELDDDMAYMLNEYAVGGVILFDRNLQSHEQVTELNKQLQKNVHGTLPLFIGIDEEGGNVARMKDVLAPPPSQREVAASGDVQQAFMWAASTAKELKSMGFNINFAPVADVGNDAAERMYSDDAEAVTEFVEAAVKGYESQNMLCSLKHFPGIGRGESDSHHGFVNVAASDEEMASKDLVPFRQLLQTGNQNNFFVMVTHVTYSAFDAKNPASFSPAIMDSLLRGRFGYNGVIITDDLDMGAIANYYDYKEVGVKAVAAGADIVMVCHDYGHEADVYNGILRAVRDGSISMDRINASVRRIIKAKLLHLI